MNDYDKVFQSFTEYRKTLGKSLPSLTKATIKKINKALEVVTTEDLILLFTYLSESTDEYCSFINGDNDNNRFYGTLDNLFRKSKLKEKINRAKRWKLKQGNLVAEKTHDLFMPFMIVEQEEVVEKKENNIGTMNFQMSIFAQTKKGTE
tara:strand:- start:6601 stop:7047 length:447 start_codon:yes stop_codon:yes gene_type:complete